MDEALFWWINSHNTATLDWIMWCLSAKWSWAVVILSVIVCTGLRCGWRIALWLTIGVSLCFLFADQISNHAIKDVVQRLRPCHALDGVHMFREGKGGKYGFVSSHAANIFAIVMFFSLLLGSEKSNDKQIKTNHWLTPLLFLWAILVCYSRVYLGKHYPGDVFCGALLGLGIGALVYFVISKIRVRISSKSVA